MKTTNSIFEEGWWLDAVAPGQWKELKVERDGVLIARWPIVLNGKKMHMPKYTQTLGIWMNPDYVTTLEDEENVDLQLIEQMPTEGSCELSPENTCFLPFIWQGFNVSVEATYVLDDLSNTDAILRNMSKAMQRDIKQASRKVKVEESNDIERLIAMSLETYKRQGRAYVVKPEILRRLYQAARKHNACSLLEAKDAEGRVHSMTLFVYDERRCYYLVGASDPALNAKSCANTLLIWEGIKIAAKYSKVFDFEGSMIQGISTFFRRFGSKCEPYYMVTRHSMIEEIIQQIKPRVKSLLGHKK